MKKFLLLLVAMVAGLSVWAQQKQNVVNTVTSNENITSTSTVYVGEVVVDGQSVIKYIYSGDIYINTLIIPNVVGCISGMADADYAALLTAYDFPYYTQAAGFAICNNPDLEASMDANWSNAQYVGALYYPSLTVKTEVNGNLYDLDEGFKAVLDVKNAERTEEIDNPVDAEKRIISHTGASAVENVYYTVEDGLIIKHVETIITYDCEATTVIYTKVELESAATTFAITLPESFENGTVICDKASAAEGETVTLTVTPDNGYELETLTVTTADGEPSGAPLRAPLRANVDLTPGENGTYTFAMPAAPVTVNATFKETTVTGLTDINAAQPKTGQRYNLMGQPVDNDYKGIVIENGVKKIIR